MELIAYKHREFTHSKRGKCSMAQARPVYWNDPGPLFDTCKDQARRLLDRAAIEWSKGDPSQPNPSKVLDEILGLFAEQKFLRRPYGAGKT